MTPFHQKQVVRGSGLFLFGALYTGYAVITLPIGTPTNPGAGMFPLVVGSALALFGIFLAGPALIQLRADGVTRERSSKSIWQDFDPRAFATILGALAAFAITVAWFGLVPAIVVMTAAAALGNRKISPTMVLVLSGAYVATTYLVFILGLGLPLDLWRWPF